MAVELEPGAQRTLAATFVIDQDETDSDPWSPEASAQIGWPCQPGPTPWGHGNFSLAAPDA